MLEDYVVSMRWKTWHNTRSSDWPKRKQKAPFHWSKLTPACTYVTLEFDQNKVSRGQKVILVQQRKQAKIGFETFRSKYIKLCVSSDVGKKEIRSERKRTCFLRRSNMRFSIRALSIISSSWENKTGKAKCPTSRLVFLACVTCRRMLSKVKRMKYSASFKLQVVKFASYRSRRTQ